MGLNRRVVTIALGDTAMPFDAAKAVVNYFDKIEKRYLKDENSVPAVTIGAIKIPGDFINETYDFEVIIAPAAGIYAVTDYIDPLTMVGVTGLTLVMGTNNVVPIGPPA